MDKQNHNLRTLSEQARVKPPAGAWNKLERKLDADLKIAKRRKSKLLSNMVNSVAACVILLACLFIYQETQQDLTVSKGNIAEWEELLPTTDNHFDVARIHSLTTAYRS